MDSLVTDGVEWSGGRLLGHRHLQETRRRIGAYVDSKLGATTPGPHGTPGGAVPERQGEGALVQSSGT